MRSRNSSSQGRLGDHGHQGRLGLGAFEERRELEHHVLDVGPQRAQVGEFELVEEDGDRVHHQLALVGPAAVRVVFATPARPATSPS